MDRRFITFLLLSFLVIQGYVILFVPKQQPDSATTGEQTTSTVELVTEGARTSDTLQQLTRPAASAETTTATAGQSSAHPGEITTQTMSKYVMALDHVGAVVNNWEILDPGSVSSTVAKPGEGLEVVRRIPQFKHNPDGTVIFEPGKIGPQTWPLEIGLVEQGVKNYEDFNNVPWQVEQQGDIIYAVSPEINGLRIKKEYVTSDDYTAKLRIVVQNMTSNTVQLYDAQNRGLTVRWGPGLMQKVADPSREKAYDTASYCMDGTVYKAFAVAGKDPIEAEGPIRWAALESKFFAAIVVPYQPDDAAKDRKFHFRSLIPLNHQVPIKDFIPAMTFELSTSRFDLAPMASETFDYTVYVGPKKYDILKKSADRRVSLQSLMFHDSWSFMRFIYLLLTDVLNWFYTMTHNYGIAIIFLTILVRLIVWPLTQKGMKIQQKSMAEMSRVKPFIDEINEKYKDNPQEKSRRTWEVYKEHNISPFASLRGCMPLLLQLPIFFGLYKVCNETIDLYGAQFLWINDLSQPDRLLSWGINIPMLGAYLNLLPITMALTQFLATWLSMKRSKNMDPTQRNMMYIMPLVFVVILYQLPAGLMLYWNISNIWQIFQTMIINKILEREEKEEALKPKPAIMPTKQPAGAGKFTKRGKTTQKNAKPGFWDNFRKTLEKKVAEAEKMRAEAEKQRNKRRRR